jgi:hypothetical protein
MSIFSFIARPALIHRHAQPAELARLVAAPRTEVEAAVADHVHHRHLLSQQYRIVERTITAVPIRTRLVTATAAEEPGAHSRTDGLLRASECALEPADILLDGEPIGLGTGVTILGYIEVK